MKQLILILFLISSSNLLAGSHLPDCQGNDVTQFDNCMISIEYPSGDKYDGEFKGGKFNGLGTYTYGNGNKYVGEFKDDNFNGQGTFTTATGDKYEGEYKNGLPDGQGTATYLNGKIESGTWVQGVFAGN